MFKKGDKVKEVYGSKINVIEEVDIKGSNPYRYLVGGLWYCEDEIELVNENNNKPDHYKTTSIDVIDFCDIQKLDFLQGNVVKYTCRAGKKQYDGLTIEESEIKDYKKAIDYLQRKLKYLTKND